MTNKPLDASVNENTGLREERLFLVLSIFIGIIGGLLVVSFRMAIEWLGVLLRGSSPAPHQLRLVLAPTLVGLVLALLMRYVFPDARGSGVNQTKAALYIHNGYISVRSIVGKFFLAALSIGSGQSLGPEDPSLHLTAGVASKIGRSVGLSREKLRLFAPVGAAAGVAAAFNAPIAAILLVIEEVIGQWTASVLGSIVLAAVSAVAVSRWFWGAAPMFRIPAVVPLRDPRELLAYAVLGVVGGFASLIFAKALAHLRPALRRQPQWFLMLQPALAGLLIGGIAYFGLPEIMGPGYEAMDAAMHAQFTITMLLTLALLKILAGTISYSCGAPGGMFAPTLFIGAMLGAAVGMTEKIFLPHVSGSVGSYALVGIGVLFAAFIRAPLTSVFMVLEISGNYAIILPVILANTIAYLISRAFMHEPILEVFTHQDGLYLPSMEEEREDTSELRFEDALLPPKMPILQGTTPLREIAHSEDQRAEIAEAQAVLVQCTGGGWYAAKRSELGALIGREDAGDSESTLESLLGEERTPTLYPDQPLALALPHFRRWPVLPVGNRALRGAIEGCLTLDDVIARFQKS